MPNTFPCQPVRSAAAGLCLLLAFLAQATVAADVKVYPPGSIGFKADANVPGVSVALVDGNPKEGPYTVRAKFEPGLKIPAHTHPDTRVVTVISGTYYFAQGDEYDEKVIRGYAPGTVIVIPANTPHYAGSAEDGAVVQESGVGPTGITLTGK